MKMSSKKTMLTAAVLVTLSSGSAFAATPGTVDSQELFHANRLVTDPANKPALEEDTGSDRYEASISAQKKERVSTPAAAAHTQPTPPARLRWESVDARIAARNNDPSFTLAAQKAKPVIITAEDIRREEKQAAKEGRPVQELVGDVNMNRPVPPPRPKTAAVPTEEYSSMRGTEMNAVSKDATKPVSDLYTMRQDPPMQESHVQQPSAEQMQAGSAAVAAAGSAAAFGQEQRPTRARYPQLPHEQFSLTPPAENGAPPKQPERFGALGSAVEQHPIAAPVKDALPSVEHSVRPAGVPDVHPRQVVRDNGEDLAGVSDEVRRHILAGQLAMEVQLQRDPSVAGMRAITKVLRENTTLTRLQKIDFLIGFGRALHQSGLPRQQEALLIKTIAEAF
ncbi:hypothetical protein [uncultured Selenomonas sp.]|uniref:hypothetical protein n=1 Tax=uncultured Selenomonas sp. TaxID=159275 RepID=UPI0028DBB890|nr:hypothetical protein [uncultured Selenomonas sp.]